jgi:hypothetical protein
MNESGKIHISAALFPLRLAVEEVGWLASRTPEPPGRLFGRPSRSMIRTYSDCAVSAQDTFILFTVAVFHAACTHYHSMQPVPSTIPALLFQVTLIT